MKTMKKALSIMISMVLIMSMATSVAVAEESELFELSEVEITSIDIATDSINGSIELGEAVLSEDGLVEFEMLEPGAAALSENTPPVAGLQYVILNPESLKNGNLTTNTQIAWLWSYNGENYTYDPDGDTISNISVDGIPANAIVGYITGDIGFATQFDTAGQYQMTYQVQDARGAWSNIVKVVINIEPADSNTRPTCNINHNLTAEFLRTGEQLVISWANSSDSDSGDYIAEARGLVYKDGSASAMNLSDYVIGMAAGGASVQFDSTGTYEIWMSVCDSLNAWSNWVIFTIEVRSGDKALTVATTFIEDTDPGEGYWVDNFRARELSEQYQPKQLLEETGSKYFPSEMERRRVAVWDEISGTLKYDDGTPCVNMPVKITMPMTAGCGLDVTVNTDSTGNFLYNMGIADYWARMGYKHSTLQNPISGDCTGLSTQYTHYSSLGTNFYYPTTVTVTAGGKSWSESVSALAGIARAPIIGRWIYLGTSQGEAVWDWLA